MLQDTDRVKSEDLEGDPPSDVAPHVDVFESEADEQGADVFQQFVAQSLGCLPQTNGFRKACIYIVRQQEFDTAVLVIITGNAVLMAMDDPREEEWPNQPDGAIEDTARADGAGGRRGQFGSCKKKKKEKKRKRENGVFDPEGTTHSL